MPQRTNAAALWLAKADEARALAERTQDPQIRSSMLRIAESWEHLASIAERAAYATKPIND
jgi:hypothetical protein